MTDLTERLRTAARKLRGWAKVALATDPQTVTGSTLLYEEAADEIEDIRERLAAATKQYDELKHVVECNKKLLVENDDLTARLAASEAERDETRSRLANVIGTRDTLAEQLRITKAALQPFAKVAADIDPKLEGYMAHHYDHLVGHYRAAALAVAEQTCGQWMQDYCSVTTTKGREMDNERMMKWFEFEHLPEHLKIVSIKFYEAACSLCALVEPGPERTVALRKLLEAKDAAVRAKLSPGG